MKAQYQITEDDYANAVRFATWRQFIARPSPMTLIPGGAIAALLGISVWTRSSLAIPLLFAVAAVAILFAVVLLVRTPSLARRHYRQYKGMQEPMSAETTDAGISFSNADGEAVLPWPKILQWRQNDRFILIYAMPVLFHIVPKSIAREGFDVPLLVQRLIEHVGPER